MTLRKLFTVLVRLMVNLRFAVVLLSLIAIISIVATVAGGMYGEDAQQAILRGWPFTVLMLVFAFDLALAVASRYPWKVTHAGWIVTHTGLVTIVAGHMLTAHLGHDGRVDLFEGQVASAMEHDDWMLTADVRELGSRMSARLPPDLPVDVPISSRSYPLPGGDALHVERYWPTYALRASVQPDLAAGESSLAPAILLSLESGRKKVVEWLVAGASQESTKAMGEHLRVVHRVLPDAAALESAASGAPRGGAGARLLAVSGDNIVDAIPVSEAMTRDRAIGRSGFTVKVARRFERFRIADKQPVEADDGPINPALLIEVADARGHRDRRFLFAAHGEVHGDGALDTPFELRYVTADDGLEPGTLAVLEARGCDPVALVVDPEGRRRAKPLVLGEALGLPWIGGFARVIERYPRAKLGYVPWCSSYAANRPALLVSVRAADGTPLGDSSWVVWNPEDRPTLVRGRNGPVEVRYGPRRTPLGFSIRLDRFHLETYEGTDNPKSFESFVTVIPQDGRAPLDYRIYMNHPLTYEGVTLFQSSYDPETLKRSIFQASYDPGWRIVYLGYALTVLGLVFIVYLKPIVAKRQAQRLAAAGLARAKAGVVEEGPAAEAGQKDEEVPPCDSTS